MSPARIGLYGGSFDPVHNAHLALARLARDQLQLDELWWIPAGQPWQKSPPPADAQHRAAMVALAIEGERAFVLERCELDREGPSFTLDTVRELQQRTQADDWFLVLGEDQYRNLPTWHGWEELIARVTLAIARRPLLDPAAPAALGPAHRVEWLALPPMTTSSTAVRDALVRGEKIDDMVPAAVARYIAQHHLYT